MAKNNDDAITASLRIISYRPRSEGELRKKLLEKGFDDAVISPAIEQLTRGGYIDDEKYAVAMAESRTRNKGWGPAKIAADLANRSIDRAVIKRTVEPLGAIEEETARAALGRWARKNGLRPPLKGKSFQRAARHLKARGFSFGAIMKVIEGFSLTDE